MILLGAELIDRFQPVLLGFAGLLLFSSWKLLTRGSEDEDLSDNNIVRLCRCSPTCLANMHDLFILEYNEFLLGLQQANLNMRSIQQQKSCRHMVHRELRKDLSFQISRVALLKGVLCCRRFLTVTDSYDGDRFFTVRDGQRVATPLLLALAVVEISDVVFAVDSIPAVCLLVFPWMLTLRISENFGGYSMITA